MVKKSVVRLALQVSLSLTYASLQKSLLTVDSLSSCPISFIRSTLPLLVRGRRLYIGQLCFLLHYANSYKP